METAAYYSHRLAFFTPFDFKVLWRRVQTPDSRQADSSTLLLMHSFLFSLQLFCSCLGPGTTAALFHKCIKKESLATQRNHHDRFYNKLILVLMNFHSLQRTKKLSFWYWMINMMGTNSEWKHLFFGFTLCLSVLQCSKFDDTATVVAAAI